MTALGWVLFDTAMGKCGVAWGDRGIAGVQLPEATEAATRARMRRRFPGVSEASPPAEITRVLESIIALLRGGTADFSSVELDLTGIADFQRRVYQLTRSIPAGETTTYGAIATRLGDPATARAVGQALGANPFPIVVPCHRVVAANGRPGGFSAAGGVATKLRLLEVERAGPGGQPTLFDAGA